MDLQQDFKELLELFNVHNVEYIIIGAFALAFHGAPRYTGDLDILINPNIKNATNILLALKAFGFGSLKLTIQDFTDPDNVIQLGVPPVRIDLVTSITGISWDEAKKGKVLGTYGDITVPYLGKKEFIANKRALGRKKDFADLEALGEESLS